MHLVDQSPEQLSDGAAVWLNRFAMRAGDGFGIHVHEDLHQLIWSPTGVLLADAAGSSFVLPSTLALWIPAGVAHDVGCARPARLHSVYVEPQYCPISWTSPTVVGVGDLLAAVLDHLAGAGPAGAARARAERFMFDLLQPVAADPSALRLPLDGRAADVAAALLRRPADQRTIEEWGREVGASGRTLARHFRTQTGMSFGEWRTQARIQAATALLGDGATVATVAAAVGYRDAAAFAAAFRRHLGVTPTAFARSAGRGSVACSG